ncbi:hypothetical protein [Jonquetella anthropi]|uniref:hypothetical protein n=1 Tax=Jonquetella anthropi TaxID=428712 RepID=UPI0023F2F79C|nr:hypothetical protein [Jonquetella anthropi]
MESQAINLEAIDAAIAKLDALPRCIKKTFTKDEALAKMKTPIRNLIKKNYPMDDIARMLSEALDVEITEKEVEAALIVVHRKKRKESTKKRSDN